MLTLLSQDADIIPDLGSRRQTKEESQLMCTSCPGLGENGIVVRPEIRDVCVEGLVLKHHVKTLPDQATARDLRATTLQDCRLIAIRRQTTLRAAVRAVQGVPPAVLPSFPT